jgi:hypothetical protein
VQIHQEAHILPGPPLLKKKKTILYIYIYIKRRRRPIRKGKRGDETINSAHYCSILNILSEAILKRDQERWKIV